MDVGVEGEERDDLDDGWMMVFFIVNIKNWGREIASLGLSIWNVSFL